MTERIDTGKLLHTVARTPEYARYRQEADAANAEHTQAEKLAIRNRAISLGALAMARSNTAESGYRTPEGTLYALMSHLDTFSHAQDILNTENNLPRHDRITYKKQVIEFNHSLKAAIDTNPSTGLNGMLRYMTEAYASINGNESALVFMGQARRALVGMQHERAAEQIIDATDGYEVDYDREVGVEDELHGVDLYVRNLDTDESFGIDLKASEATAERSRLKSRDPSKIVWSQCRNEDFGDSFQLPRDVAARKAVAMEHSLDYAAASVGHSRVYSTR